MYRRKHFPGEVRPARPARCCADALLTGVTTSDSMPVLGLYAFCLQKPGSITYCAATQHPVSMGAPACGHIRFLVFFYPSVTPQTLRAMAERLPRVFQMSDEEGCLIT